MIRTWMTLLALGGCTTVVYEDQPAETGDLEVTWRVGVTNCIEAGLDEVALMLDGEEVASFACTDGYGAVERLPAGRYAVRLVGRDANGWARYDATPGTVRVEADVATAVPMVVLGALPGDIVVTWYFDNGRMCGANGVADAEVTLFDSEYVVDSRLVPCDSGMLPLEGLRSGAYQVNVMGRDAQGGAVFNGVGGIELDKGDRAELEVMLEAL